MKRSGKQFLPLMLIFSAITILIIIIMQPLSILHFHKFIAILFPKGIVALEERNLLFIIQAIMLLVVIPVYILTFVFSWRYRVNNPKGKYDPHLIDNIYAEYLWWGIPLVLTIIISILTWQKTHELDPFKPIKSDKPPMTIQVVALQWKWLFIYPEQKIASVNFVQFPINVPIKFEVTADAPMNSLWIPHLGGQIYAMPKMRTYLNLIADQVGDFRGASANISGEGFSGMHFIARASSEEDFQKWVEEARKSSLTLDTEKYDILSGPSKNNPVELFQLKDEGLFDHIVNKYEMPPSQLPVDKK